jgi:hypothetical protein
VTVGFPVFADNVEDLFGVVPLSTTENERDVGENDRAAGTVTVRVTANFAFVYPVAEATTVSV